MWRGGVWAGLSTTKMRQQIGLEKPATRRPAVRELNGLCSGGTAPPRPF